MALVEFKNKPSTNTPINATNLNNNFNELNSLINNIYNKMWPIGRGFIDFTETDYSDWLGFIWERELVGLTPVGLDATQTEFNTIGKTGGSKFTEKHSHGQFIDDGGSKTPYTLLNGGGQTKSGKFLGGSFNDYTGPQVLTTEFGSGNAGNLQPYKVVAYWKRIA